MRPPTGRGEARVTSQAESASASASPIPAKANNIAGIESKFQFGRNDCDAIRAFLQVMSL